MHHLLINRFQGSLLGLCLGEIQPRGIHQSDTLLSDVTTMAIWSTKSLIDFPPSPVNPPSEISSFSQALAGAVPSAFFFHDNTTNLKRKLLPMLDLWGCEPITKDGIVAIAYTIAQCCREKLQVSTLIPEIIAFIGETTTSLPQKLLHVDNLLNRSSTLAQAEKELSPTKSLSSAIAMGFYCFMSSVEDFRLSLLRSNHLLTPDSLYYNLINLITGALSGAHNTIYGIPTQWQILLSANKLTPEAMVNISQMLQSADALVAVWSGVYDISLYTAPSDNRQLYHQHSDLCVFAAPGVIRPKL